MGSSSETGQPILYYERGVGTTWMMSFEAVEAKSANVANLLRLWAFLDNKDLWYGLLEAVTKEWYNKFLTDEGKQWPQWIYELAHSETQFLEAV
jgi:hypothetical protein